MPIYKIRDNQTGKTLTISGDQPPSEQDALDLFSAYNTSHPQKSLGGFAGNVLSSGANAIGGIASGLINTVNPDLKKNTVANILSLTKDAADAAAYKTLGRGNEISPDNKAVQLANFYKDRYGGVENTKNTLYNDPVGVALDASTILGGGGAALKAAGTASKIGKLGEIGNTLNTVSRAVDPISAISKGFSPIKNVAGGIARRAVPPTAAKNVADFLAVKSLRPSPSQVTKFQEIAGEDLGGWMNKNKLYTAKDAENAIVPLQNKYNNMVRTGTEISGKSFADKLRQRALDIVDSDRSQAARSVAEQLWNEADVYEKSGLTDSILTESKTSSYNKVPNSTMTDPIAFNTNKEIGNIARSHLDVLSPGSANVGKKLQALREFNEMATKQQNLGRGSQVFNLLKPSAAGFMTGAAAGSFIPVVGNVAGGLTGVAGSLIANSSGVQRNLARRLSSATPLRMPNAFSELSNSLKTTSPSLYGASRIGRLTSPPAMANNQPPTNSIPPINTVNTPYNTQTPSMQTMQKPVNQMMVYPKIKTPIYKAPKQINSQLMNFGDVGKVKRGNFY